MEEALRTRERLLVAASEVFAEKGYREATISEICERARANIAAVNYHFRDKQTLYREAWRHSFSESIRAHPPDGGVSESAPSEERLQGMIRGLLRRISDENNKEFSIVYKELANPTGLLKEVMEAELRPIQEKMEGLLRELLGSRASEREVRFSAISIVSQCITPMLAQRFRKGRRDRREKFHDIDDIDAYADHVVNFSLAGIRRIREEIEGK